MPELRARSLLGLVAVTLAGCLDWSSPTLPVPPPSAPDVTAPDSAGLVTLTGTISVRPNAQVNVTNISQELRCPVLTAPTCDLPSVFGGEADAAGSYTIIIPGRHADRLEIRQTVGTVISPATEVVVP